MMAKSRTIYVHESSGPHLIPDGPLRPMAEAEKFKTGPIEHIWIETDKGNFKAHWAHADRADEGLPEIPPGWYYRNGGSYELIRGKALGWRPVDKEGEERLKFLGACDED